MTLDFNKKTALVCGSTQGIGYAVAKLLAESNASLVLVSRDEEKLKAVLDSLPNEKNHRYLVADFTSETSVSKLTEQLKADSIDIVINNTGGPNAGGITNAKTDEFLKAFQMHLLTNHSIMKAVLPTMKEKGFGRIINIISTSVKQPLPNLGVSNTIRAAVANWSKTLANEVAPFGITVNNVLPGATKTQRLESIIQNKAANTSKEVNTVEEEMKKEIPMKRFASPEEVANAVVFLASEKASYITGINVPVDGGRTACL